jgi:transposase
MQETVTLSKREQQRLVVMNGVLGGQCTVAEAAGVLGLSVRQVRRIMAAYRQEGAAALAHGNRGSIPANAVTTAVRQRVVELARGTYAGCNHQHLSELLAEREQIAISRSALRRILVAAGERSPRTRRSPKHRRRRERYPQEGMLLQIDASSHDWLQERGPRLTLLGAIDDATGRVVGALFREREDAQGYFLLLEHVLGVHGRPVALYHDRHGIFAPTATEKETLAEQLAGKREPSQFGRLLAEMAITSIAARSPQAKGRIERLWGTFQDRLVSELRLAGAATLAEAAVVLAGFVPRHNQRFAVPAAQEGTAYRPLEPGMDLEAVCCFRYTATVGADNVVRFGGARVQLLPGPDRASYARAQVEVQERLDGSLVIAYQGQTLASRPAPADAPLLRARTNRRDPPPLVLTPPGVARVQGIGPPPPPPSRRPPPADHPWRRSLLAPRPPPAAPTPAGVAGR